MTGIGLGLGIAFNRNTGVVFNSEYQTVYDSLTTKPPAAVASAQNTMVQSLVDAGVWAKREHGW